MPFIHFRPITVISLNDGINGDLVFGGSNGVYPWFIGMVPAGIDPEIFNTMATYQSSTIFTGGDRPSKGGAAFGSGAWVRVWGNNVGAGFNGRLDLSVPNAAKNNMIDVATILGVTDTPFLDMHTHRIAALAPATTDMDAAPLTKMWTAWTPTLTWTAGTTPAAITKTARWCQIGKVVFFECEISSADSNACTGVTISLPVNHATNSITTPISAIEYAPPTAPTSIDPLGYINSAGSVIAFLAFRTATDGQAIVLYLSGQYEVA
jgi:hypothetical protein